MTRETDQDTPDYAIRVAPCADGEVDPSVPSRLGLLRPHARLIGAVLVVHTSVLALMALLYGVAGLALVWPFRRQVLVRRACSTLLAAGIGASVVMLGVDVLARPPFDMIENPVQLLAGAPLSALLTQFRELRAEGRPAAAPVPPAPPAERAPGHYAAFGVSPDPTAAFSGRVTRRRSPVRS